MRNKIMRGRLVKDDMIMDNPQEKEIFGENLEKMYSRKLKKNEQIENKIWEKSSQNATLKIMNLKKLSGVRYLMLFATSTTKSSSRS